MKKIMLMTFMILSESCSLFSDEGAAIDTAKYSIIKPTLKDPNSFYTEGFKVVDKIHFKINLDGVDHVRNVWFIHGNVTASNSFGGKVTNGYCVLFWQGEGSFGTQNVLRECARNNPTQDEIATSKALMNWDSYKKLEIE